MIGTMSWMGGYGGSYAGYMPSEYAAGKYASGRVLPDGLEQKKQEEEDGKVKAAVKNPGESTEKLPGRRSSPAECETCKNRKYQDGSDEMVSFKSAAHISPDASASRVRAHEQEHVANAYNKAAQKNGKVISASVSLQTAICPECGRTYISGGETRTQIKYYNEDNPYQKDKKAADAIAFRGRNVDLAC